MRPIEINLSFSATWMQGQHVDEYHSAYKETRLLPAEPPSLFRLWDTGGYDSSFLLWPVAHSLVNSPYSFSFLKDLRAAIT